MINNEMFLKKSVENLVDKILLDKNIFNEELIYPIKDIYNEEFLVVIERCLCLNRSNYFHLMIVTVFMFDGKYYDWEDYSYDKFVSDDTSRNELFEIINSSLNYRNKGDIK